MIVWPKSEKQLIRTSLFPAIYSVAAGSLLIASRGGASPQNFEKRTFTNIRLEPGPCYESAHQRTVISCSLQQWQTESKVLNAIPCYQNPTKNKLQRRLTVNTVSKTLQKQIKGILPAQLTDQANFTPMAVHAIDNQRLDKRTTRLFAVNSNMHLEHLIAINVLLQCRLASFNCSINSPKETYNKTYIPKTVYVSQLRYLVF